jgi:hypothetical protein
MPRERYAGSASSGSAGGDGSCLPALRLLCSIRALQCYEELSRLSRCAHARIQRAVNSIAIDPFHILIPSSSFNLRWSRELSCSCAPHLVGGMLSRLSGLAEVKLTPCRFYLISISQALVTFSPRPWKPALPRVGLVRVSNMDLSSLLLLRPIVQAPKLYELRGYQFQSSCTHIPCSSPRVSDILGHSIHLPPTSTKYVTNRLVLNRWSLFNRYFDNVSLKSCIFKSFGCTTNSPTVFGICPWPPRSVINTAS